MITEVVWGLNLEGSETSHGGRKGKFRTTCRQLSPHWSSLLCPLRSVDSQLVEALFAIDNYLCGKLIECMVDGGHVYVRSLDGIVSNVFKRTEDLT